MSVFESKVQISKSSEEVFTFLSDFNNHRELMPEMISDWNSDLDTAVFSFQNMAKLSMKISERQQASRVLIVPNQQVPFPIQMEWKISPLNETTTEVTLSITAELNMMLKMVASGPLNTLVSAQTKKLKELLS